MARYLALLLFCSLILPESTRPTTEPASTSPTTQPTQRVPAYGDVYASLYNESVLVIANDNTECGSGVVITRNGITYVITAGHVVKDDRGEVNRYDEFGRKSTEIMFRDVFVVQEVMENGDVKGRITTGAEVIRYEPPDGLDIAVLRLKGKQFAGTNAKFYLEDKTPLPGTPIIHCGSMRGEFGINTFSTGIVAQTGHQVYGKQLDRSTCTLYPGSSGGGIFLQDGRCIGIATMTTGENLNHFVPIRRIMNWAKIQGLAFLFDERLPVPSYEDIRRHPIETPFELNP